MNDSTNDATVPEGLDPRVRHRDVFVEADAIHLEKMRHQVQIREFTIVSDEPESLGGENQSPYPLDYLAAGVATCLITQMVRYGHMLKARLDKVRVRVRIDWYSEGSVMAGTIAARCTAMTTHVEVESADEPALIAALIHNARAGCYAEAAMAEPVEITASAQLNGEMLDLERHPKRPPRRGQRGGAA
jgi:uncharacterized OsmC-like protein